MDQNNKTGNKQDVMNHENKYFSHIIKFRIVYSFLLVIIIFTTIIVSNFFLGKPLIMGAESYYHLSTAQGTQWNPNYLILKFVSSFLSLKLLTFFPLILNLISVLLLFKISEKIGFNSKFTTIFTLFLIISPTFIFSYVTISIYSLLFFYLISGFLILSAKHKKIKYISLLFFILAMYIDIFTSLFTILLLIIYVSLNEKNKPAKIITLITFFVALINFIILKLNLILGPFHQQQVIADLISDFGGLNGISFFLIILAIIGLSITWKKKNYYWVYLLLVLIIPFYIYNTQVIFHLSLLIIFFSTVGFVKLFERKWESTILKKFTLLILILVISFSTITYLERINQFGPQQDEIEVLTWIKESFADEQVIFSSPENAQYIRYFSQNEAFSQLNTNNNNVNIQKKNNLTQTILNSIYTSETFPLLEENDISIIYITKSTKEQYPVERGLLFLLRNEKFKLKHSYGNSEVWVYDKR